jgi:calcineurin-like phosphoesterase family protein/purple acid phosphatase-like protein
MRTAHAFCVLTASLVACGASDEDPPFTDSGGTLAITGCDYSVTTRIGAEPPRVASGKLGPDPTPRLVHLGIVGDPRTSIVAQWRTADETTRATTIRYAVGAGLTADQLTEKATGIEFGYEGTGADVFRVHQAHVCGLTPNTTYSYMVGAEGHFSPVYEFHTAPDVTATPDAEVVIGFVGDTRGGYDVWASAVAQLKQRTPDVILFSGDAVLVGLTQFEWEDFFGRAEALFATVPVVAANGNHENNAINFYSQFAMPGNQENFGFDYGFAHITVANDTPENIGDLTGATVDALRADFEASKAARWKLLMHHQPMWSASFHHSNLTLQGTWGPLVDQYKLDLVLSGHEHEFELTKPMFNKQPQTSTDNATVYLVAGGAGAELYDNGTDFWTQYSEKTHSAAVVHVRRTQLTLDAFRPDGTAIPASFTKTKP